MSDNRLVDFDKKHVARVMSTAVAKSRQYLQAITVAHHRGPADTWTAARDRAARAAGIESSYAARIWNRWQDMKDVSGEAFMRLQTAYQRMCERSEAIERRLNAEAERIAREAAEIMASQSLEDGRERLAGEAEPHSPASIAQERSVPPHGLRGG